MRRRNFLKYLGGLVVAAGGAKASVPRGTSGPIVEHIPREAIASGFGDMPVVTEGAPTKSPYGSFYDPMEGVPDLPAFVTYRMSDSFKDWRCQ